MNDDLLFIPANYLIVQKTCISLDLTCLKCALFGGKCQCQRQSGINSTPSTGYQPLILQSIKTKLLSSRLNKFNDFEDSFNGLGISVHDISAQKISLLSFQNYAIGWLDAVPLSSLTGVGAALSNKLAKINLHTVQDLLLHLPLRYEDRTHLYPIGELLPGRGTYP